MVFNPSKSVDFSPEMEFGNKQLEVLEEIRLLGVTLRSDLRWSSKTEYIVKRAYNKLWVVWRLKTLGANQGELVDVYSKQF